MTDPTLFTNTTTPPPAFPASTTPANASGATAPAAPTPSTIPTASGSAVAAGPAGPGRSGTTPDDLAGRVLGSLDVLVGALRALSGARVEERLRLAERRKRRRERRQVSWKHEPDGMFKLFGTFDPVTGARIETALTSTANRLWHGEDPKNRATAKQRLADALEILVTNGGTGNGSAAAHGNGSSAGHVRTTCAAQGVDLLVIADYDTVAGQLANPRLGDGTPLSPQELVRLACDANILPALFDRKGQPLWLGRARRHASAGQRAALTARDKGCIGCGAGANWCQAHHIQHWEHGGTTDIDNLCLLCSHCHHHQVHTNGAQIARASDGRLTLTHPDKRPPPRPPPPGEEPFPGHW